MLIDPSQEYADENGEYYTYERVATNRRHGGGRPYFPGLRDVSSIRAQRVEYLWDGRLPKGKLTSLEGDPAAGKSTIAVDISARVSSGEPMPGETGRRTPANVLYLAAEDGFDDTIRPRLDATGLSWSNSQASVWTIEGVPADDGFLQPVSLPGDIPYVEKVVQELGVVLLVVDVFTAYVHGSLNMYRDQDVRRVTTPLAAFASRTGCCVLLLRHLKKERGGAAMYAGGGSIAITGAARAVHLAGKDPGDPTGRDRVLAITKMNIGAEPKSLRYRLEGASNGAAAITWLGESDLKADDLIADPAVAGTNSRNAAAEIFLKEILGDGEVARNDVFAAAERAGFKRRSIYAAFKSLAVGYRKTGYGSANNVWFLPDEQPAASSEVSNDVTYETQDTDGTHGEAVT